MSLTKLRPSFTFTPERLEQLKQAVPEAFADGKVNWEALREILAEHLEEEEEPAERFGLFWPGKRLARRAAATPPQGTLLPAPGEGVNEEATRNLFIEGENLEVLKLLLKSYAGRVKMIYIDPPYNTGNDFVYADDYAEPVESYLRRTGQAGEKGELLTTNPKTSGRYHSNWLNMIYPRLVLARQLLREDGVIFISIDNNEVHNLRQAMDETFGSESFVDCIIWQKKVSPSNDATWFSSDHDYLLVYAASKELWKLNRLPMNERQKGYYQNPDSDPRGPWNSATYTCNKTKKQRPNLYYAIVNPFTNEEVWPSETAVWAYSKGVCSQHLAANMIYWGRDGRGKPRLKKFLSHAGNVVPRSVWSYSEVGHTQEATQEFMGLFPSGGFETPKPTRLVKRMLELSSSADTSDLILDFFAGSCTTAHAVLALNREDGGNRRFIMVQLPEPTPADSAARQAGFPTIAEIGKERIRRVIARMQAEQNGKLDLATREQPEDLGFRVYKLARSHFRPWQPYQGESTAVVQQLFNQAESPLVEPWQPAGLLVEIMLQEGFPLDSDVAQRGEFAHNAVERVSSEFCEHRLFACLDARIVSETAEALPGALGAQDVFVCLDQALTDEGKMRLADRCNLHVI